MKGKMERRDNCLIKETQEAAAKVQIAKVQNTCNNTDG